MAPNYKYLPKGNEGDNMKQKTTFQRGKKQEHCVNFELMKENVIFETS